MLVRTDPRILPLPSLPNIAIPDPFFDVGGGRGRCCCLSRGSDGEVLAVSLLSEDDIMPGGETGESVAEPKSIGECCWITQGGEDL